MIQPGPKDQRVSCLISGEELAQLKRITWLMSEAFGLDTRIENYQGKRPIGLYRWDFDCLLMVIDDALKDREVYPDTTASGYHALARLFIRLTGIYQKTLGA
jgi:hypothetical protein